MYVSTSLSPPEPAATVLRKRWRWPWRFAKLLLAPVLFVFVIVLGASLYLRIAGGSRLNSAITRVAYSDPHWRWADLQAQLAPPDEQNAALVVTSAAKLLPERWPPSTSGPTDPGPSVSIGGRVSLDFYLSDRQWVPIALDPRLAEQVKAALAAVQPALAAARKLTDMPDGRYPAPAQPDDYFAPRNEVLASSRRVVSLLWIDAADRAERSEAEPALASTLALLNAARAFGAEPNSSVQLTRMFGVDSAIRAAERVLAQTQPPAAALATLQKHFENELRQPLLVCALRGERALGFDMIEGVRRGESERFHGVPLQRIGRVNLLASDHWLAPVERWLKAGWFLENQARVLEETTRLIELTNQAASTRRMGLINLQQRLVDEQTGDFPSVYYYRGLFLYSTMPGPFRLAESQQRHQAELGALVAALAAERFRIAHGQWPETLEALTPTFLSEVPGDPFADAPLRCQRREDGFVIYSLAEDGLDNDGLLNRSRGYMHLTDRGVRLWDPAHRRQSPTQPVP